MAEAPISADDATANPVLSELESKHARLAGEFMQAWSARDVDRLVGLLADDVVYMVYEGGPTLNGPDEVRDVVGRFMERWQRIEFSVDRLHVIGPLVINERREEYDGKNGQADWRFFVAGLLVIKDGKIGIWRDYSLPGKRQVFD
jgi:limonene-1,2-epoxide hydrolase